MDRRGFLLVSGALAAGLASAGTASAKLVRKFAEELKNGEFNWFPERSPSGPIVIVVSIPEQKVHVYRNGIRIAASTCSTGKKGHETPTGVFTILQKDKDHRSATYDGAAMPNMNRLTWDGIALHAGNLPGYPASHGCVRLPMEFSELLFGITQLGMTVILADEQSFPPEIVHPSLMLSDAALG
ncbi:L,D-transpeptidase family protein [Gellertiella hungarica]